MDAIVKFIFGIFGLACALSATARPTVGGLIPQLNCRHRSTEIDFVFLEFVSESMSYDGHEIGSLTQGRVDLVPLDVDELVDTAKAEATNGPKLVL